MAVPEASILPVAATSEVAKCGRPCQYTVDELGERKNGTHAFAFTTRKKCLGVLGIFFTKWIGFDYSQHTVAPPFARLRSGKMDYNIGPELAPSLVGTAKGSAS
ncbi:unnamed protein product [Ixodes pacificus]